MKREVIDFHSHPHYDFHNFEHGTTITLERFRDDLLACGISRACGSVIYKSILDDGPEKDLENMRDMNRLALEARDVLGDFYIPGIHVHPEHVKESCEEIEKYHALGVNLIGELVPYMTHWKTYGHPGLIEIAKYAAELDMVMNIHATKAADMSLLPEAVPELKLVVAHLYGYGEFAGHIEMMRKFENVSFDYSAHGADRDGTLRYTIDRVGKDRVLFGTDYPGVGPAADLAAVLHEDLTEDELDAVLAGNAKRLLKL